MESGDYFAGGHFYGAAKLDFACRAGLVDERHQFTDEQLTGCTTTSVKLWRAIPPLTKGRCEILEQTTERISGDFDCAVTEARGSGHGPEPTGQAKEESSLDWSFTHRRWRSTMAMGSGLPSAAGFRPNCGRNGARRPRRVWR